MELSKLYNAEPVEDKWFRYWIEERLFVADPHSHKPPFSIVIPPPNITGSLHMGHALNNTLQDTLVRYKKMTGFNVLWLPGTDHAGIATQNVVERLLKEEGIDRREIERETLIERIWEWKEESGRQIIDQLKRLGAGCDWTRERFTMDAGLSRAVREVFVRLYKEGLIYRANYIINWCPRCGTALSDLEVEYKETEGSLYYINYPLKAGKGYLTIATTRPETMLGDTAVAVHPEDVRYKGLIGKGLILPLTERVIPVIGDEYVDMAFGTGALKITPAHDPNDFLIGKKHNLREVSVIGKDGRMTEEAGSSFAGMDRFECRKAVVEDLKRLGLLLKVEHYIHRVGHCYRCDTVVEPLVTLQWFVKMKPLAEPAIQAVKDGRVRFIPKGWENTYFSWMENIKDWCISRQIYWGHRIPVWYCQEMKNSQCRMQDGVIVSVETPLICPHCGSQKLIQDEDVLDTWFSSSLWPFSTLGWPEDTDDLKVFYPTSVLVTSFDIIFFWVARMLMMGLKFMGDVPFRDVYIHALVRDVHGQKMSKSKGNVIDPLIMMERYGTDALRFTLISLAAQGRDIRLSQERMEGYRNFVNKLWNAARFVFMNIEDYRDDLHIETSRTLMDRWILSRLQLVIKDVRGAIEDYRFNDAASFLYQFVWHEYCDWYIEASKPILSGEEGPQAKKICQRNLLRVLEVIVKLLHPFMPFVTEEIWSGIKLKAQGSKLKTQNGGSILLEEYPEACEDLIDKEALKGAAFIIDVIKGIRNIRSEFNLPPSLPVKAVYMEEASPWLKLLKEEEGLIKRLARVSTLSLVDKRPPLSVPLNCKELKIFVLLEGTVDFKKEEKRLKREMDKLLKGLSQVQKKLADEGFSKNAPCEVVNKEREKEKDYCIRLERLKEQVERIRELC